jgi:geranylgeranyl diphosphate synthase type II
MEYSLLAPGKRLRPLLALMAAEACGDKNGEAMAAACAVEMVHTYSLIHDDLPAMDDDDMRRGRPTCHRQFGEAMAILAGDALLTLAFQVLTEHYPPVIAGACCRELARGAGAAGMVGGQVEDLAWETNLNGQRPRMPANVTIQEVESTFECNFADTGRATFSTLERIHACKTGALFRTSLRLGAWTAQGDNLGGPNPAILACLDEYGRCFGQAFQITDDLLDVEGQADVTGKGVQKDADRGKLTYPGMLGAAESRTRARDLCMQARTALGPLGGLGEPLASLTELILERTS